MVSGLAIFFWHRIGILGTDLILSMMMMVGLDHGNDYQYLLWGCGCVYFRPLHRRWRVFGLIDGFGSWADLERDEFVRDEKIAETGLEMEI